MNLRVATILAGLLYVIAATTFGFLPHNHDTACVDSDCGTCVWLASVTDAPAQSLLPGRTAPVIEPVFLPAFAPALGAVYSPTVARAPPELLA